MNKRTLKCHLFRNMPIETSITHMDTQLASHGGCDPVCLRSFEGQDTVDECLDAYSKSVKDFVLSFLQGRL